MNLHDLTQLIENKKIAVTSGVSSILSIEDVLKILDEIISNIQTVDLPAKTIVFENYAKPINRLIAEYEREHDIIDYESAEFEITDGNTIFLSHVDNDLNGLGEYIAYNLSNEMKELRKNK